MEPQADWLDAASEHEQEMRDDAIAEIRRQIHEVEDRYYINCQWCGDHTEEGARYCGPDCAADAERAEKARKRNGGVMQ